MLTQFADRHRFLYSNLIMITAIVMLAFTLVATQGTQCAQAAAGSCSVGDSETFTSNIIVNEDGDDADTRIEGDTNANLLYVDAGNDRVGIGTASPATLFDVNGALTTLSMSVSDGNITNVADIAVDSVSGDADSNTTITFPGSDVLSFQTGGSPRGQFDTNGTFFVGETLNAGMSQGITVNQAGNSDEIISTKATAVGHDMTNWAEADTYGSFRKSQAAAGGLRISGLKDADGTAGGALILDGFLGEAADTTDTSGSVGVVQVNAFITSGGGAFGSVANAGNIFVVTNNDTARLLVKGNGDLHVTNTTLVALDNHDDIALIRDLRICLAQGTDQKLNDRYNADGSPVDYGCDELVTMGLLAADEPARVEMVERVKKDEKGETVYRKWTVRDEIMDVDVTYQETVTELIPVEIVPVPLYSLTNTSMLVMDALRTYAEASDARFADLEARVLALGG